jgi:hypothetical protein
MKKKEKKSVMSTCHSFVHYCGVTWNTDSAPRKMQHTVVDSGKAGSS